MIQTLLNKYKLYIFIIGVSCIPLISIFNTDKLLHTHDGFVHLARIAAYFKALQDGQLPPRFAGDLNYGYGVPLFVFIYQLPYFFASIFLKLGFSLVDSFRIVLAASYFLSGIFILAFARQFFNDDRKSLLVAVFYQFAPFRFIELLTRGSFGEVYTYTFLPLVLYGLALSFKKMNFKHLVITSLAVALLILSHNSISLVFFSVSALFIIFFGKNIKQILFSGTGLLTGLILSVFYWLPAILEHKYTYGNLFMKDIYLRHFPPIKNLLIPNILNSKDFQIEGISTQIGLFHILAILFAMIVLFTKKNISKRITSYGLLVLGVSIFFILPVSGIFWKNVSLLRQFQFPWRFLSLAIFASSFLSITYLEFPLFKKKIFYWTLILLVIFSTVYYWQPALGYDEIDEKYYWNYPLTSTYFGETDVIWSEGPAKDYPQAPVETVSGKAAVVNYKKKSNLHTYAINAEKNSVLVDHTQYFPGWRVYVDGEKTPIEFQDQNWRGEITFPVAKGNHNAQVIFGRTKVRLIADLISLVSLGILLVLWIKKKLL